MKKRKSIELKEKKIDKNIYIFEYYKCTLCIHAFKISRLKK